MDRHGTNTWLEYHPPRQRKGVWLSLNDSVFKYRKLIVGSKAWAIMPGAIVYMSTSGWLATTKSAGRFILPARLYVFVSALNKIDLGSY